MANLDLLAPKILRFEGGFVNDPVDRGGATNMGVTLSTWRMVGYDKDGDGDIDADDVRKLSRQDFIKVLRFHYWNRWQADEIQNQSIAEILVDWVWASGRWGIVIPQRLLKVLDDGMVGRKTLGALNMANPNDFHARVFQERKKFIESLVSRHPEQKRFLKGWLTRLEHFKFEP